MNHKLELILKLIPPILLILFILSPFLFSYKVSLVNRERIFEENEYGQMENIKVGIVFGAGLDQNGYPSQVLAERVRVGAVLYKKGIVQKLIMSGDNRYVDYNEPLAMQKYAIELGVDPEDIQPDFAGRRTYDTCIRAKEVFGVNEAVLITQDFHINRALYICNKTGIKSYGVIPTGSRPVFEKYYRVRDIISLVVAFIDVKIRQPDVVLGEKISI